MPAPIVAGLAGLVGRMAASTGVRSAAVGAGRMAARRVARGGVRPGAVSRFARMKGKQFLRDPKNLGLAYSMLKGSDDQDTEQATESYTPESPTQTTQSRSSASTGTAPARSRGSADLNVVMPQRSDSPDFGYQTNATLSSITEQVEAVVRIAKQLGVASKKQEQSITDAAMQNEQNAAESMLEAGDAAMVQGPSVGGNSIEALEPEVNKLIDAIRTLRRTIFTNSQGKEKQGSDEEEEEEEGSDGSMAAKVATAVAVGALAVGAAVNAGEAIGDAVVSAVSGAKETGEKAFEATKKAAGAATSAIGATANKIADFLGFGVKQTKESNVAASQSEGPLKRKINQVAKPLVEKSLQKSGLSSIPIVSGGGGLMGSLGRLLRGDADGAGVDQAAGLDNAVAALPVLVDSISRDVYKGVYGIHPEQDPLSGERLPEIKTAVEEIAKQELQGSVESEEQAVAEQVSAPPATPTMEARPMEESAGAPPAVGSGSPGGSGGGADASPAGGSSASPAMGASAGGEGAGGAGAGAAGGAPAPAGGPAGGAEPVAKDEMGITAQVAEGDTSAGTSAAPVPTDGLGAAIASASEVSEMRTEAIQIPGTRLISPTYTSTTKPYASGMGDVPEPSYMSAGDLMKTVYFGAVAGAMV